MTLMFNTTIKCCCLSTRKSVDYLPKGYVQGVKDKLSRLGSFVSFVYNF